MVGGLVSLSSFTSSGGMVTAAATLSALSTPLPSYLAAHCGHGDAVCSGASRSARGLMSQMSVRNGVFGL